MAKYLLRFLISLLWCTQTYVDRLEWQRNYRMEWEMIATFRKKDTQLYFNQEVMVNPIAVLFALRMCRQHRVGALRTWRPDKGHDAQPLRVFTHNTYLFLVPQVLPAPPHGDYRDYAVGAGGITLLLSGCWYCGSICGSDDSVCLRRVMA